MIDFSPEAHEHLDKGMGYYESLVPGLGFRFRAAVLNHVSTLQTIPFMQVKYDQIRCVPILGFPYLIHYTVLKEANTIRVHGVIHTSRNPADNWNKHDWIVNEEMPLYAVHAYDLEYHYAA